MSEARTATRELARFSAVGGLGLLLDVGTFNVLRAVLVADQVHNGAVLAKVAAVAVAILANWVGNRLWTFRDRRRPDLLREAAEFAAVSIVGGGIAVLCLWVSHDLLGLTSPLADNISANGVGLLLGSGFRFVAYRSWVFGRTRSAT